MSRVHEASVRHALEQARAGGVVLYYAASRSKAVQARDIALPGKRGFRFKVGKGSIRFDWSGKLRIAVPPEPIVTVIDECTEIDAAALKAFVDSKGPVR